ncbi:hypothetical protein [Ilumatobacter fluminis]|uniref:hypothetical protein n=1 Tax=Ilumatobacter fluminis TaxID=467091 RepID=UPI001414D8D9|nr:hypothetical protein [Ilumatobacter fluminis]
MELIIVAVLLPAAAFVLWRVVAAIRGRSPERAVDSGHPHLTDVDPHSSGDA